MTKSIEPERVKLKQIADALGVPVERFFGDIISSGVDECLLMWSKIKTPEGRLRALEALRAIADKETT